MNGKKAKLMRAVGKVDKKTKRLYNQLSADEKKVLTNFYTFVKTRKVTSPDE